jgi:DNA (cytosine-5)-methyltransferase 1
LTIDEIKALASYPEEFQFVGSYRDRWARIGNSVPPLFMKALAENISRYVFGYCDYMTT